MKLITLAILSFLVPTNIGAMNIEFSQPVENNEDKQQNEVLYSLMQTPTTPVDIYRDIRRLILEQCDNQTLSRIAQTCKFWKNIITRRFNEKYKQTGYEQIKRLLNGHNLVDQNRSNRALATNLKLIGFALEQSTDLAADDLITDRLTSDIDLSHLDPISCDPEKRTLIHLAVQNNHVRLFDKCLQANAQHVNLRDIDQFTPLQIAAQKGQIQLVDKLIKSGANPNTVAKAGITPLLTATGKGHTKIVDILIKAQANLHAIVTSRQFRGFTPLHLAARHNHTKIAKLLIGAGADPNKKDANNQTPLDIAKRQGHADMVQLLSELTRVKRHKGE